MRYSSDKIPASGWAFERVVVPLANLPHGLQQGTDEQRAQAFRDSVSTAPVCGIRALTDGEEDTCHRLAEAYARSQGVEKYDDVHPICVKALRVYQLATACVDPDSDPRAPLLFFGDTIEEAAETLRNDPKRNITGDTVAYLHERFEMWRDKVNPQANTLQDFRLAEAAEKAADDADFLAYMRPGLRLKFTHTLAALLVASPAWNSISSTLSSTEPSNSGASPQKTSPQPSTRGSSRATAGKKKTSRRRK